MKKRNIDRAMIARILTVIFTGQLFFSCTQLQQKADPAEEVLNNLHKRFSQYDYASAVNPYADFGKELGKIYQTVFQMSTHEIYHGTPFVPLDAENQKRLKGSTKAVLKIHGIEFAEEHIDRFTESIKDYKLTSEDVTRYLSNAVGDQTITKGEHDIIFLELREMAGSTTNARLRSIIGTVEYEVINSNMSSPSKKKILLLNALAKNSLMDDLGPMANRPFPPLLAGPFQKTTPVVIGTILVVWAVIELVAAWTNPSCGGSCQTAMYSNVSTYVALSQLVCSYAGENSDCPCNYADGCYINGVGHCVCP